METPTRLSPTFVYLLHNKTVFECKYYLTFYFSFMGRLAECRKKIIAWDVGENMSLI